MTVDKAGNDHLSFCVNGILPLIIAQTDDGPVCDSYVCLQPFLIKNIHDLSVFNYRPFEKSGAVLNAADLHPFYSREEVLGLAEVMDYVAVEAGEPDMVQKLMDAHKADKRIDGHLAGLSAGFVNVYRAAGGGAGPGGPARSFLTVVTSWSVSTPAAL